MIAQRAGRILSLYSAPLATAEKGCHRERQALRLDPCNCTRTNDDEEEALLGSKEPEAAEAGTGCFLLFLTKRRGQGTTVCCSPLVSDIT